MVAIGLDAVTAPMSVATADPGTVTPIDQINGAVPPGVMAPLVDKTVRLDTIDVDGNRLFIFGGIRKPGTRTPIHKHRDHLRAERDHH